MRSPRPPHRRDAKIADPSQMLKAGKAGDCGKAAARADGVVASSASIIASCASQLNLLVRSARSICPASSRRERNSLITAAGVSAAPRHQRIPVAKPCSEPPHENPPGSLINPLWPWRANSSPDHNIHLRPTSAPAGRSLNTVGGDVSSVSLNPAAPSGNGNVPALALNGRVPARERCHTAATCCWRRSASALGRVARSRPR